MKPEIKNYTTSLGGPIGTWTYFDQRPAGDVASDILRTFPNLRVNAKGQLTTSGGVNLNNASRLFAYLETQATVSWDKRPTKREVFDIVRMRLVLAG